MQHSRVLFRRVHDGIDLPELISINLDIGALLFRQYEDDWDNSNTLTMKRDDDLPES